DARGDQAAGPASAEVALAGGPHAAVAAGVTVAHGPQPVRRYRAAAAQRGADHGGAAARRAVAAHARRLPAAASRGHPARQAGGSAARVRGEATMRCASLAVLLVLGGCVAAGSKAPERFHTLLASQSPAPSASTGTAHTVYVDLLPVRVPAQVD